MVNEVVGRGQRRGRAPDGDEAHTAGRLTQLAGEMAGVATIDQVLTSVVAAAVREVPGAEFCGVTILSKDSALAPAANDELVVRVDAGQVRTGEGPSLDAAESSLVVRSDDLRVEERWPRFARIAAAEGVRSILAFPLITESGTIGALNIYSRTPAALGFESERIGFLVAAHAATAIVATQTTAQLRTALDSRDVIGQAKGILMERYRIDADKAFALLIRSSQSTNIKLVEIARRLVATGNLAQLDDE